MHPFYKPLVILCLLALPLAACEEDHGRTCPPDMSDINQWEADAIRTAQDIEHAKVGELIREINDYIDRIKEQLANGDLTQVEADALIESADKTKYDGAADLYAALQQTIAEIQASAWQQRAQRMKDSGCNDDDSGGSGASLGVGATSGIMDPTDNQTQIGNEGGSIGR